MNAITTNTETRLIDEYLNEVISKIHISSHEQQRIQIDLRAHFQAALEAGESPEGIIARMGSPAEVAAGFMAQVNLNYATFLERLVAFFIDIFVILLGFGIVFIAATVMPDDPLQYGYVIGGIMVVMMVGVALGSVGMLLLYFPILEGRFGQTLGKRVTRLRVLAEDGLPIGYKAAFLRRLSFYFEIWPIDGLFILFTEKRQRAFDIVARTIVVREGVREK